MNRIYQGRVTNVEQAKPAPRAVRGCLATLPDEKLPAA